MLRSDARSLRLPRSLANRLPLLLVAFAALLLGGADSMSAQVAFTGAVQVVNTGSYTTRYATSAMAGPSGNLYLCDFFNGRVLVLSPSGAVSVLATPGITLQGPIGIWVDSQENVLIADAKAYQIYKVTAAGAASVVATPGYTLYSPEAVGEDAGGNIYIADTFNYQVLKVTPGGTVSVVSTGSLLDLAARVRVRLGRRCVHLRLLRHSAQDRRFEQCHPGQHRQLQPQQSMGHRPGQRRQPVYSGLGQRPDFEGRYGGRHHRAQSRRLYAQQSRGIEHRSVQQPVYRRPEQQPLSQAVVDYDALSPGGGGLQRHAVAELLDHGGHRGWTPSRC